MKLVSIIVPAFNYAHLLPETLNSIKNQSYLNYECLIVDDGSTDNTAEVARSYCNADQRIKYIYQENKGLSDARNMGINQSKGDYIQFLDADDLISEEKIALQVDHLLKQPIDVSFSRWNFFYDLHTKEEADFTKITYTPDYFNLQGSGKELINKFIYYNRYVVSSPLIKREVINKVGLFDIRLKSFEDWDYWLRILENQFTFGYINHPDAYTSIRISFGSMISNRRKMITAEYFMRKNYKHLDISLQKKLWNQKRLFLLKLFLKCLITLNYKEISKIPLIYIFKNI